MARDWEATFRAWSKPSSDTEEEKCDNASRMIRAAITEDPVLSDMNIEIIPQGSYRNNTNVRTESDVDICVRLLSTFHYMLPETPPLKDPIEFGVYPSSYTYPEFRNAVEHALVNKFGRKNVVRGNKAFDVHANTYRVDADVVACFEYRAYTGHYNADGSPHYWSGTSFLPDNGGQVVNWPNQHYQNGVAKNEQTGNRFKFITRVLKRLRNEMRDKEIMEAEPIPSFLIECLVWNVPDNGFASEYYIDNVRWVLAHCFNNTMNDSLCAAWGEVSDLKYLFGPHQKWTRAEAHAFLGAAWDYVGFE